jgi:hypothetical protein
VLIGSSIVAVHGLGGHWKNTWTDGNNKALWLRDFLPSQLPAATIMSYGYNSDTFFTNSVINIDDVALALLDNLEGERRANRRSGPIIFFSHSLGGIIVKKVDK